MVLGPLLPDHVLRLMSPADRKLLGKAGRTAAETLARAEAKSENELQEQIASMLKRREIVFIRPAMFRKSTLPPGWPDFTFAYRGIAIGWECKSVAGEPSDEQLRMHAHMEANGWRIDIIRSLHGAVEILNGIDLGE